MRSRDSTARDVPYSSRKHQLPRKTRATASSIDEVEPTIRLANSWKAAAIQKHWVISWWSRLQKVAVRGMCNAHLIERPAQDLCTCCFVGVRAVAPSLCSLSEDPEERRRRRRKKKEERRKKKEERRKKKEEERRKKKEEKEERRKKKEERRKKKKEERRKKKEERRKKKEERRKKKKEERRKKNERDKTG